MKKMSRRSIEKERRSRKGNAKKEEMFLTKIIKDKEKKEEDVHCTE